MRRQLKPLQQILDVCIGTTEGRELAYRAKCQKKHLEIALSYADQHLQHADSSFSDLSPIFIFSAGWRSGSTLVQRMIMAEGSTLIWGEPYDKSEIIQRLSDTWRPFCAEWPPESFMVQEEIQAPEHKWIANLYPTLNDFREGQLALLHRLFAKPAHDRGYHRWGIKEVRLTVEHAAFLQWLIPKSKFIFIYRNPLDAYTSYKPWRRWFQSWPNNPILTPRQFGNLWSFMTNDFIDNHRKVDGILIKYEDISTEYKKLGHYLGLDIPAPRDLPVERGRSGALPSSNLIERRIIHHVTNKVRKKAGY